MGCLVNNECTINGVVSGSSLASSWDVAEAKVYNRQTQQFFSTAKTITKTLSIFIFFWSEI